MFAMSAALRRFQIHQHEKGARATTINGAVSSLRFLHTVTLRHRELARDLVAMRRPDTMREGLSVEEAVRRREAALGIKYKAALSVAYGAGLRISEVAHLKIDDIDSQRILTAQTRHQQRVCHLTIVEHGETHRHAPHYHRRKSA